MKQVLVAVGDGVARRSVAGALAGAGYTVREADTGIAALTVMAASPRPLVVVLDAQLPDLDGQHVLRFAGTALHAGWRSGMVLLAPESPPPVLPDEWEPYAWSPQVIVKPVNLDTLVTAVRIAAARQRSVSRRRAARALPATVMQNGVGA